MRKTILFIFAVVGTAIFSASFVSANHSWSGYHWNLSTEDTIASPLRLGNNLTTSQWQTSLGIASEDWNQSVLKNATAPGTSNANCDPTFGQVEVCNSEYGSNGWLGIAQIWTYRGKDRGHIAQGIVKVNDTYFNQPNYSSSAWRNLVICQEVGHTFGLGHQDEDFYNGNLGSCMDYTNDPDGTLYGQLNNEHPNAHDYDMLAEIYDHLNTTTTGSNGGGNGSRGGGPKKNEAPSQALSSKSEWGRAITRDAQGNNSLYVRDLGNGWAVTTHVIWVK